MDKYDIDIYILLWKNLKERVQKMIWPLLVPWPFLKVVLNGNTQQWVRPIKIQCINSLINQMCEFMKNMKKNEVASCHNDQRNIVL
jgi:hypothetical protein